MTAPLKAPKPTRGTYAYHLRSDLVQPYTNRPSRVVQRDAGADTLGDALGDGWVVLEVMLGVRGRRACLHCFLRQHAQQTFA